MLAFSPDLAFEWMDLPPMPRDVDPAADPNAVMLQDVVEPRPTPGREPDAPQSG